MEQRTGQHAEDHGGKIPRNLGHDSHSIIIQKNYVSWLTNCAPTCRAHARVKTARTSFCDSPNHLSCMVLRLMLMKTALVSFAIALANWRQGRNHSNQCTARVGQRHGFFHEKVQVARLGLGRAKCNSPSSCQFQEVRTTKRPLAAWAAFPLKRARDEKREESRFLLNASSPLPVHQCLQTSQLYFPDWWPPGQAVERFV